MAVKRRVNKAKEQLSDLQWDFLCDKHDSHATDWETFLLEYDCHKTNEQLWNLHRDVILIEHVKESPGTRPALWWKYDAPRLPAGTFTGCWYDGKLPEPRKRIGGTGTPAYEVMCVKPSFSYGIPDCWAGIDEDDPPTFESQAAYLKRYRMFLAGEERRADFELEAVPKSWDWDSAQHRQGNK